MTTINHNELLSSNEVADLIKTVGHKRTVLVQGENGIGKTAILYAMMKDPAFANYHVVPPIDCTQLSDGSISVPDIDRERGVSRELPNERLGISVVNQRGVDSAKPTILCFDEMGKSKKFIKDMIAPIVYERRVGSNYLPDGSIVFATTNLSVEGLGDLIEPHLRNRIIVVTMRKPTYEEWAQWAVNAGINEYVMLTAKETTPWFDSFLDYEKGGRHEGKEQPKDNPDIFNPNVEQDAYVTPRSLSTASDILNEGLARGLTDRTIQAALTGCIGASAAQKVAARMRFGSEIPDMKLIFADPMTAPLPDNPAAQLVLTFKFMNVVKNGDQAHAVLTYLLKRMRNEMQVLFAHSIKDAKDVLVRFSMSPLLMEVLKHNRKFL